MDAVATSPIRSVTAERAESSVSGSKFATYCAERDSASIFASRTPDIVGQEDELELRPLGRSRDVAVMGEN